MAQLVQTRQQKIRGQEQEARWASLPRFDYLLLGAVGALVLLGLMLVYSGSYDLAFITKDGNSAYYLVRQVLFLGLGLVVMLVLARSDYMSWRRWSVLLLIGALVFLGIVLAFGAVRYGAQRTLLDGSIQPSEVVKLITVLYIADWLASKGDRLHDWGYGLIPFGMIIGAITALILLQPDFGTAITIVLTAGAMLFMAGIDWKQMAFALVVAVVSIIVMMLIVPHTHERLDQYIQGLQDPAQASEQMRQVWLAMRMGGFFGVGLGNGLIRVAYLPLAHTDSIFAVAAIELGLLGVIAVTALYATIGWRGYRVALHTGNSYGQLLVFGATTLIIVQALINVAVMAGVMPLTGIPLPLMSYGGSSLVAMLAAVGAIQSVYRGSRKGVSGALLGGGRGGTGGHVYPALAIVERLPAAASVLWIGGEGGVEQALVARASVPFAAIPAGGLHGVGLVRSIRNALKLIAGTWRAWRLAGKDQPRAMLTTGGFVSGPAAVACWLRRVPILLYLPDIEPGLAVKFVARFARKIGVTTDDSARYFSARKTIVTGYPTRSDLAQADRATAIRKFDLVEDRQTLLVFGGSKGARSINRAITAQLETLLAKYQVIHISGATDATGVQAKHDALPDELKRHYHVFEYVHEMGFPLAAADLVVSRAGASILGEYPLFGLPSILVAYPYAWRYQKVNADYLAAHGAAIRLDDETLSETLGATIDRVLGDAGQRQAMSHAARSLARPAAAVKLAQALQELAA